MKKYLLLLFCTCLLSQLYSQKTFNYAEYAQYWEPVVTDTHFDDIEKLKDELIKKDIADKMYKSQEIRPDGPFINYTSWDTKNEEESHYSDFFPETNAVGILLAQSIAYPIDYINGKWVSCCYYRHMKNAMSLSVTAVNCDNEHYKKFIGKIEKVNKLLGLELSPTEAANVSVKKPFMNKANGYTYIFDTGVAVGYYDTSFTYLVIPTITHAVKALYLTDEMLKSKDVIVKKDTIGLLGYAYTKPFNNYDSLKSVFLVNGIIPNDYAEVYPSYFSFTANDTLFFDSKWEKKWFSVRQSNRDYFIVKVQGGVNYEVERIEIMIKNSVNVRQAVIDDNYRKLEKVFKVLGYQITDSVKTTLEAVVRADRNENYYLNTDNISATLSVMASRHYCSISIEGKRNYGWITEFMPYKPKE